MTWRPGGPIRSAAVGGGGAGLRSPPSGLGWAGLLQCVRACGSVSAARTGVSRVVAAGGSWGGCSSGVLWWCLGGLWTQISGGLCGMRSRLVDLCVMHSMVMDET